MNKLPPLPKPGVISGVSDHGCPACDARIRAVSPIALGYDAKQMEAFAQLAADNALEKAAKHFEAQPHMEHFGQEIGDAIRAMKGEP
jgi:hypothetical protein